MSRKWFSIFVVPVLLAMPLATGCSAEGASFEGLIRGQEAKHFHVVPEALRFRLRLKGLPGPDGRFEGECRIEALLGDMEIALRLTPSPGVELVELPAKLKVDTWLRGTLHKGKVLRIRFVGQVAPGASRPTVLNGKVRFAYPVQPALDRVREGAGAYGDPIVRSETVSHLEKQAAEGERTLTVDRALLIP